MRKISGALLSYTMFPKRLGGLTFKFSYYLPGIAIVLLSERATLMKWAEAFAAMIFLEGIFGTSRKVVNDLRDYQDDARRAHRWTPVICAEDRPVVLLILLVKLGVGIIIATVWHSQLLVGGLLLIGFQCLYDLVKERSTAAALCAITAGYVIRALAVPASYVTHRDLGLLLLVTLGVTLIATARIIEWRYKETLYIANFKLIEKPGSKSFGSPQWRILYLVIMAIVSTMLICFVVKAVASPMAYSLMLSTTALLSGTLIATAPRQGGSALFVLAAVWTSYIGFSVVLMKQMLPKIICLVLAIIVGGTSIYRSASSASEKYFRGQH